jgi:site-specific DNA-cytosine methylase
MVDGLHILPPCQPFSAAHTVPSQIQDEINQAALFSVWHLLEKIKPRVATIEGLVKAFILTDSKDQGDIAIICQNSPTTFPLLG